MLTHVYASIVKREKQADGTMIVSGPVADSGVDRDQQICDPAWLDKAVPLWFQESGNIREQHSTLAAGKALTLSKQDGAHWITARIVDAGSVTKVEHDVLSGFSVGIKRPRLTLDKHAKGGRIVDGKIVEVSLVDRPANPRCLLTLAKADKAETLHPVDDPELVEKSDDDPDPEHPFLMSLEDSEARLVARLDAESKGQGNDALTSEALRNIAGLIVSEAEDLATGQWSEAGDIACLLDAVAALRYFANRESAEPPLPGDLAGRMTDLAAAVDAMAKSIPLPGGVALTPVNKTEEPTVAENKPTTDKADAAAGDLTTPAKTETGTQVEAPETITKADLATAVSEAITKATEPLLERLAKVEALPTPGGPVRMRTTSETADAVKSDHDRLRAEADELLTKADAAEGRLATGYRERADAILAKIA